MKQDLIEVYDKYKKYNSEYLFSLLYETLSKYLTSIDIKNIRSNDYEITFYIDREYKIRNYKTAFGYTKQFQVFGKRTQTLNDINDLIDYINSLKKKELK